MDYESSHAREQLPSARKLLGGLGNGVTHFEAQADLKWIALQLAEEIGTKRSITTFPGAVEFFTGARFLTSFLGGVSPYDPAAIAV